MSEAWTCNFIKKETLAQVISCEFCEISKYTFFTEHLWTTVSIFCGFNSIFFIAKKFHLLLFSDSHFVVVGLNVKIYRMHLRNQSECEKIWTKKPLKTDTFWAVSVLFHRNYCRKKYQKKTTEYKK